MDQLSKDFPTDEAKTFECTRHGLPPAPECKTATTWTEFVRTHMDVLVPTDFFTAEIWTLGKLVTYDVLFIIHPGRRKMYISGMPPHSNETWRIQVVRIDEADVKRVPFPARSPNVNASAEQWARSVQEVCLARVILFGEASLRQVLKQYGAHVHHERNQQGKGNVLLLPAMSQNTECAGSLRYGECLGGPLRYYAYESA